MINVNPINGKAQIDKCQSNTYPKWEATISGCARLGLEEEDGLDIVESTLMFPESRHLSRCVDRR
jgi:hypothetical protein